MLCIAECLFAFCFSSKVDVSFQKNCLQPLDRKILQLLYRKTLQIIVWIFKTSTNHHNKKGIITVYIWKTGPKMKTKFVNKM